MGVCVCVCVVTQAAELECVSARVCEVRELTISVFASTGRRQQCFTISAGMEVRSFNMVQLREGFKSVTHTFHRECV